MNDYSFDVLFDRTSTHSVKYDLRTRIFGREDVVPMWVADMDFATPGFIIDAINHRLQHPILGYSFRGENFASSLAEWIKDSHGYKIENEWVCFSPGIVPALVFSLLAYTEPGDGVIVQTPVYHPFFEVVKQNGRKVINNPLRIEGGRYTFDLDDLDKNAGEGRLLFLSNPHNPVGRCWSREELEKLAEICLRHNLIVVSDEIHSDLILSGYKHIPFASLSEEIAERTLSCYAPSKTFNLAGLSTSAVVIKNEVLRKQFNDVVDGLHIGLGNIPGTIAFEAAYRSGRPWLTALMSYIEENIRFVNDFLNTRLPEIELTAPEATYMVWLNFTATGLTHDELNNRLINNARLGLNDGVMFGAGGEMHQRMNLACPRTTVQTAMERLFSTFK